MSKQPLYTALGWTVWQIGKRYAKKRARAALPGRKLLIVGTIGSAAVAVAVVASNASPQNG